MTPRDESGFTLVELLTAMLVGGVVLMALFGLVDTMTVTHGRTVERMDALQRARVGTALIGQRLRSAVCPDDGGKVFTEATGTRVTFYSQQVARPSGTPVLDPPLRRRTLELVGTDVVERVHDRPATGAAFATTPTTTQVLLRGVHPPSGTPLFAYRTSAGAPITDAAERLRAGQIEVSLVATTRRPEARLGTTFRSTTAIRSDDPTDDNPAPEC
jgi:prepilin-type N-terminal cleavage/methylation domain-containing protein